MAVLTRLKARSRTGRPTWPIQFVDGCGQRRAVYLGHLNKKAEAFGSTELSNSTIACLPAYRWIPSWPPG